MGCSRRCEGWGRAPGRGGDLVLVPRDELRHLLRARLPRRHELGGLPSLRVVQQRPLQPGHPLQRLEALQPLQPLQPLQG